MVVYYKFIYFEKATKFCEIFTLLLSYVVLIKSKVIILQNFAAYSEYINFTHPPSPDFQTFSTALQGKLIYIKARHSKNVDDSLLDNAKFMFVFCNIFTSFV